MAMNSRTVSVTDLFDDRNVYVVPTFQRPYAWEESQWDELIEDIRNAANIQRYHYFAPLHVVKINDPSDSLWQSYTNSQISDIANMQGNGFRRTARGALNVFLVIDGQQRLITFFSLLHHYAPSFVKLDNGYQVPGVILNSSEDHDFFRNLLGLNDPPVPIAHKSKAQFRLESLFKKIDAVLKMDSCFTKDGPCHKFFTSTSNECESLLVELAPTTRLGPFMTLNDRGKTLTTLEKSKSLFMEIDGNCTTSNPVDINNVFGNLYQSLEAADAYIADDESLRQIGMTLWEGKNLSTILGTPWSVPVSGQSRDNGIHRIGSDTLYEEYFKKVPSNIACGYLQQEIVPAIAGVTATHNYLVTMLGRAKSGTLLNHPSFTQSMGFGQRDAIEDYHAILLGLRLQTKQIGFLLGTRNLYGQDLHQLLGTCQIDNRRVKTELSSMLAAIAQQSQGIPGLVRLTNMVDNEINMIPDQVSREYSALQIAEALQLIVGNKKPGGFSGTWRNTFGSKPTTQSFLQQWIDYICGFNNRYSFITWKIASSKEAYNNNRWVGYVLREYECCLSGRNSHRNSNFEIEHFFPLSWGDAQYSINIGRYGFANIEQYKQSFVDQLGNKMVLDAGFNSALKNEDPFTVKASAYTSQTYGGTNAMSTNPSDSAIQIGTDLLGLANQDIYRIYVSLRSLRLAAFAARRF